ncbi:MAG: proprotein convertase P-domain-containing protein [Thermoleophilia bacterium]
MPNLKEKGARVPRRRRINLHRGIAGSAAILALGGAFATTSAFAAAPAAPAGASATILTLNNTTAQLLPDGANVTSTIQVAGAQNVIRDVDLITNIPHTSSGDLRITLTSPKGTTVVLTDTTLDFNGDPTGRTQDDWFNGTTFDDSATKLMSDQTLVFPPGGENFIPLGSVVPEGAMAAFVGENPNGTWTLRIQDKIPDDPGDPLAVPPRPASNDSGSLNSWSLKIATMANAAPEIVNTISSTAVTPIADALPPTTTNPSTTDVPLTVAGQGSYLLDVNLQAGIMHTYSPDLEMYLISPAGTTVPLTTRDGLALRKFTGFPNLFNNVIWDDNAPNLMSRQSQLGWPQSASQNVPNLAGGAVAEGAFGAFIGENPNGVWKLRIVDASAGDTGVVNGMKLIMKSTNGFTTPQPPPPTGGGGGTPPPAPKVTISSQTVCLPNGKLPKVSRIRVRAANGAFYAVTRRNVYTAALRASTIEKWLRQGIRTDDLCGGAIGAADLTAPTDAGTVLQSISAPKPRAIGLRTAKLRRAKRVSRAQAVALGRIARVQLIRAKAINKRVNGGLTGGDMVAGAVTTAKMNRGLIVTAKTGASAAPSKTLRAGIKVAATPTKASTLVHLRRAELQSRQATAILNRVRRQLMTGLTGRNFRNGSIGADKVS